MMTPVEPAQRLSLNKQKLTPLRLKFLSTTLSPYFGGLQRCKWFNEKAVVVVVGRRQQEGQF